MLQDHQTIVDQAALHDVDCAIAAAGGNVLLGIVTIIENWRSTAPNSSFYAKQLTVIAKKLKDLESIKK